jgi:hypothetical protein
MVVRDEARGARSAGTEAYINDMSRLRTPRNEVIRPHSHLVSTSFTHTAFYRQPQGAPK